MQSVNPVFLAVSLWTFISTIINQNITI